MTTYQSFQIHDDLMESLDLEDAYSRSPADCKPHQVTQNDFKLGLEQQEAFEQVKEEVVHAVTTWASQDQTRCEQCALCNSQEKWSFLGPGKKQLDNDSWGSGASLTEDLKLAMPWLKKRSWQPLKGFRLPQKWLALKQSSSWHPN